MSLHQTAPQLFADYTPSPDDTDRCFYCGGKCGREHRAADVVKSSFTALDTVTLSDYVCPGCICAMDESATVTLLDGEIRHDQKTRMYSWVVCNGTRRAATKAHRSALLTICTMPPPAPFVVSISDSGQRQLLYLAKVCMDASQPVVTLEGEVIRYRPAELIARLSMCKRIAAATGKPALLETITAQTAMRVIDYHGDESLVMEWQKTQSEPLTRLAAWLCPPKEECQSEYTGITDRPEPAVVEARPVKSTGGQTTFGWDD